MGIPPRPERSSTLVRPSRGKKAQCAGAAHKPKKGCDSLKINTQTLTGVLLCAASVGACFAATVDIKPGADIPSVVAANPENTTFVIYPGTYRLTSTIEAKTGDVFIGQTACAPPQTACPAILSGSTLLGSLATFNGTNYEVGGQTQQGEVNLATNQCQPGWTGCIYPEDLFFDGVPLQHLNSSSLPKIATKQWWFDYTHNIIYFHDSPSGHVVETSVVPSAFGGTGNNVTIRQLTIKEFAAPIGSPGAIGMPGASSLTEGINWTIENCEILLNHGSGVRVAYKMQILNNYIHNNGDLGIGGGLASTATTRSTSSGIVISGNTITYNNYAHVLPDVQAGGIKFGATAGVVIRGNTISNNDGAGVHFDTTSESPLVDGNTIENNTGSAGFAYEVSVNSATVRNNLFIKNGVNTSTESSANAGVSSSASVGMNAYCNVIEVPDAARANGMLVIASDRGDNEYSPGEYLVSTGNDFHFNTVIWDAGAGGSLGYQQSDAAHQPSFFADNTPPDHNTYHLSSLSTANFIYDNNNSGENARKTFAEFQSSGADIHGSADTNYNSGYPTVSITSPVDQATVSGSPSISASASDKSGISKVEFYVDWNLEETVTASPFTLKWSNGSSGTHILAAMAYSKAGIRNCHAVTVTKQ